MKVGHAARSLMEKRDCWRYVEDERHTALTEAAHELSDFPIVLWWRSAQRATGVSA